MNPLERMGREAIDGLERASHQRRMAFVFVTPVLVMIPCSAVFAAGSIQGNIGLAMLGVGGMIMMAVVISVRLATIRRIERRER